MMTPGVRKQYINKVIFAFLFLTGISFGTILNALPGAGLVSEFVFPRADQILAALVREWAVWLKAALYTSGMSLLAAILSCAIGMALGGAFAFLGITAFERYTQMIWSTPLIAVSVYLKLVVGAGWGYGLIMGTFLGFYPIAKFTFDACTKPYEGIAVLRAGFSLTKAREFRYLRWPLVIAGLGTPLSSAVPLCFIGETMGEFFIGRISDFSIGLGGILRYSSSYSQYDQMWASIIIMMFLVFCSGRLMDFVWDRVFPGLSEGQEVIF